MTLGVAWSPGLVVLVATFYRSWTIPGHHLFGFQGSKESEAKTEHILGWSHRHLLLPRILAVFLWFLMPPQGDDPEPATAH